MKPRWLFAALLFAAPLHAAYDDVALGQASNNKIIEVMLRDSTTGQAKASVAYGSVTYSYIREGTNSTVATGTCVDMTLDTYTDHGWKETSIAGVYQFCVPNAALATGKNACTIKLVASGAIDAKLRILIMGQDLRAAALNADAKYINSVATTSVTTVNANLGTTQPVNFTGTGGTAYVKSDAVNIGGSVPGSATIGTVGTVTNAVTVGTLPAIPNDWITAAGIANGAIDNATFAADVGSTAFATNIIALAADKAVQNGVNVTKLNGTSTAGTGSRVADGFVSFFNVATPALTLASVNQGADSNTILSKFAFYGSSPYYVKASTDEFLGTVLTEGAAGRMAARQSEFWDAGTATVPLTVVAVSGNVGGNVEGDVEGKLLGDSGSTIAGPGAWVYDTAGNAVATTATIKTAMEADGSKLDHLWEMTEDDGGTRRFTTNALEQAPSGAGSDPADIAVAVVDQTLAGHATSGTVGGALNSAGAAADPLNATWPGEYGSNTFGYWIASMLDAPITSRAGSDSAAISVTSTVATTGVITLQAGDDYPAANPIALSRTWTDVNVSGYSAALWVRAGTRGAAGTTTGTVTHSLANGVLDVAIVLTHAQTAALIPAGESTGPFTYQYHVLLTSPDGTIRKSPFTGTLKVIRGLQN